MGTPYEKVYGRFLNHMTDFNLADLDDHTLNEMFKDWLHSAIVKTRTSGDLTRDDENEVFKNDLSDLDIELLAMGMRLAWLDQRINSTEYTNLFVGGKEEKFYSPSSQLSELRALRADTLHEMQQLYTYSTYNNNSFFD
ncbi:MAG: hypothetical protein IKU67_05190 [Firmicutes bacterium]|nr:hypothetical protein [Bacillota bacterium]